MKSVFLTLAVVVLASSLLSGVNAFALKKCALTMDLPGHRAVADAQYARDFTALAKNFKKFCDDNKKQVHCKTVATEKSKAEQTMRELVKGHPCAEAMNATDGTPSVIYFVDEN